MKTSASELGLRNKKKTASEASAFKGVNLITPEGSLKIKISGQIRKFLQM